MSSNSSDRGIYQIDCRGSVQGIGARPQIAILAREQGLAGAVFNDLGGVKVIFSGSLPIAQVFLETMRSALGDSVALRLTAYDGIELADNIRQIIADQRFEIISSSEADMSFYTPKDTAICESCIAEITDENHPRYQYLLNACSQCGPRYSVLRQLPFDRGNTSLAKYASCSACIDAYEDPSNRRYHSQLINCTNCGPQYWLQNNLDNSVYRSSEAILDQLRVLLTQEKIIAIKGVGGFHFCCRADSAAAVERIRQIKKRPSKPLAIMGELKQLQNYCVLSEKAIELLEQPARPIVLVKKNDQELLGVAPGLDRIGVMLPNTALHVLILKLVDFPIIMTSANLSGGPLVFQNELINEFGADLSAIVLHNRDIKHPIDDAVLQIDANDDWQMLRMGRGFSPSVFDIHFQVNKSIRNDNAVLLAVGADLKNTFALFRQQQIYLSNYLGDLKNVDVYDRYELEVQKALQLHRAKPELVVRDGHPDYQGTKFAKELAAQLGQEKDGSTPVKIEVVQHHHAHSMSVVVEHDLSLQEDYVAIVMDGLGWGESDTNDSYHLWGGEILRVNGYGFRRLSHLRPFTLLGGSLAAVQPWRNGLVLTNDLPDDVKMQWRANLQVPQQKTALVEAAQRLLDRHQQLDDMVSKENNFTSSIGRLFDGVAALLGYPGFEIDYEGQAAIWLQQMAQYSNEFGESIFEEYIQYEAAADPNTPIDWAVFFLKHFSDIIVESADRNGLPRVTKIAHNFHHWLVGAFVGKLQAIAAMDSSLPKKVLLSGGVMQNQYLLRLFKDKLAQVGFEAYSPQAIPANDEGIAVGQIAVAATRYYAQSS
ncbi:MAG: carbamoyltransferase HypF [Pseudomonadales bacterium]|nr:carbamoyltransferase HypF [Pseudomonadales bacterium]